MELLDGDIKREQGFGVHNRHNNTGSSNYWWIITFVFILIALCCALGFGLNAQNPFCAFAVVPLSLSLLTHRVPPVGGFATVTMRFVLLFLAYLSGLWLSYANALHNGFRSSYIIVGATALISLVVLVLCYMPFYFLWRRFAWRANGKGLLLLGLSFAACFTLVCFVIALNPIMGDFSHFAYGALQLKPLLMFTSAFGLSGVAFIMALGGFALFAALSKETRAQSNVLVYVALGFFIFACTWGTLTAVGSSGLFPQRPAYVSALDQRRGLCIMRGGVEQTKAAMLSDRNYTFVMWSEASGHQIDAEAVAELSQLSNRVIIGAAFMNHTIADQPRNQAALFSGGVKQYTYTKHHLVPFDEVGVIPGPGIIYSAMTSIGRVAMAICFDLSFPWYIGSALPRDADIFFQPRCVCVFVYCV